MPTAASSEMSLPQKPATEPSAAVRQGTTQDLKQDPAETLLQRYITVRQQSETLCAPLRTEDYVIQSMPDVSPSKWHLAHVTWFFEQFVLRAHCADYCEFDPQYAFLFNSYYVSMGERHQRAERGLLSRPTVSQVMAYRQHVDSALCSWVAALDTAKLQEIASLIELGLNHEQQHQELMLMDIKHVFSCNPLLPAYREAAAATAAPVTTSWRQHQGGIVKTGYDSQQAGFFFDNETPQHDALLQPFEMAEQLVSNGDWLKFMQAGGYQQHALWLSDGWAWLDQEHISAPLYWQQRNGEWFEFTLNGLQALDLSAPVCHISFYEAEAYASWADARLPTEFEWEATAPPPAKELANTHPNDCTPWYAQVWQWTRSSYAPYPRFKPLGGALGEYNGKFMNNQYVMRGSACVTPPGHTRQSYRNFFYPHMRWQFSGLRLARDLPHEIGKG